MRARCKLVGGLFEFTLVVENVDMNAFLDEGVVTLLEARQTLRMNSRNIDEISRHSTTNDC